MARDKKERIMKEVMAFFVICIFVMMIFIAIINSNGGPGTDNTYKICSGEGQEVMIGLFGQPYNACIIKDCNQQYDGITYCDKRTFIVCGDDFCARPWEEDD